MRSTWRVSIALAASGVVVVAGVLLADGAAQATGYTPQAPAGSVLIAPGGTQALAFTDFAPHEDVTFTITGEDAAAGRLASVLRPAQETSASLVKQADASGTATVSVTLPTDAQCVYQLKAAGPSGTATESIDSGVACAASSSKTIPPTGIDLAQLVGIGLGAGVLLAGGVVLLVVRRRTARRRDAVR